MTEDNKKVTGSDEFGIQFYIHCIDCVNEGVDAKIEMSPRDYSRLSVGITEDGKFLRIVCNRHKTVIDTLELKEPIQAQACDHCGDDSQAH